MISARNHAVPREVVAPLNATPEPPKRRLDLMTMQRKDDVNEVWQWVARLVHIAFFPIAIGVIGVYVKFAQIEERLGTKASKEDVLHVEYRVTGERHKALQEIQDQLSVIRENQAEIKTLLEKQ